MVWVALSVPLLVSCLRVTFISFTSFDTKHSIQFNKEVHRMKALLYLVLLVLMLCLLSKGVKLYRMLVREVGELLRSIDSSNSNERE
jgi:hypothetical protein